MAEENAMTRLLKELQAIKKIEEFERLEALVRQAEEMAERNPQHIVGLHDCYTHCLEFYYGYHKKIPKALENAKHYCKKQINLTIRSLPALRKVHSDDKLPPHPGIKLLATIREDEQRYQDAYLLCQKGFKEGWAGDWVKRMARLQKRLDKIKK